MLSYDMHQICHDVTEGRDSSSQSACSNAVTTIASLYLLHLALTHTCFAPYNFQENVP